MKRCFVLVASFLTATALSQWTTSDAAPAVLGDNANAQVLPKIAATSDGGCYIGWYDNATGGYDVYLQRLDRMGNELWAHNGVLLADRSFSSNQDWDLEVDSNDNALVAFNDDRLGSAICVTKVSPAGVQLWGANGIQLNPTGFLGPPKLAMLTNGTIGVAFSIDNTMRWQMLATNGAVLGTWNLSETGKPLAVSDIAPGANGSMVLLYVRRFNSNINSAKALWAQCYDANGAGLWNAGSPLAVYAPTGAPYPSQGGSIQIATFPRLVSDGKGGVVCGWYEVGGPRNALVQHIRPDGSLRFPLHGLPVEITTNTLIQVECSAAYDWKTDNVYATSIETNIPQSLYRTLVQKITGSGVRAWGDSGVTVINTNSNQPSFVQPLAAVNGVTVVGLDTRSALTRVAFSAGFSATGVALWGVNTPAFLSSLSGTDKGRLTATNNHDRYHIAAWQEGDFGNANIHANRLNEEGPLGNYDENLATSSAVIEGSEFSGGLGDLVLSDDNAFTFFNDDTTLGCSVEFHLTGATQWTDLAVVELESAVARPGLSLSWALFNYQSNAWSQIAGLIAPTVDCPIRVNLTDFQRFVPITGQDFYARVTWAPVNDEDPAQDGWLHSLDQIRAMGR